MDDYRAIENLLYLYADRIDAGDLVGVAELLGDAVIIAAGDQRIEGYEAILGMYRKFVRIHNDGTPRTQHLISNAHIRVDEAQGTAESSARFTVLQATGSLSLQPIIVGRYADQFANKGGEWQFAQRAMIPALYGDVSEHLLTTPS